MEPEATEFSIEDRKKARRMSISNRQLLLATSDGNLKEMRCLIGQKGADVNFKDRDGNTPLHWAAETGNMQIVKLLLSKGALNVANNNNETPIDICNRLDNHDILKVLKASFYSKSQSQNQSKSEKLPDQQIEHDADLVTRVQQEKRLNPVHGNVYQLKVLMLFLYRGVSRKYSFRLGTEIKEAKKFDDLIFEYTQENRKVYRLLQAKHKLDESKKITSDSLLAKSNGDYSLIKYFFSYRDSKKEELFKNGTIKDITICTNIDFDEENLKSAQIRVEKIKDRDDILDVKWVKKQPMRYKLNKDVAPLLKRELQNHTPYSRTRFAAATTDYSDDEINDFLNHLVFAVNQPNETELGEIVKKEIGKEFDLITTENVYNKFFITMLNWLQGKERGIFLSYEEGKEFFEEARRGIPIWFGVRDPVGLFVGRTKQLSDLHKILQGKGETASSHIVAVSGLGGIGKSELTRKYINEYSRCYDNKIIWINAEKYQTLVQSFHRLASDKLGINTKNADGDERDISSIVEDVYKYFYKGKCLFVFDNAEKYKSESELDNGIEKFLPSVPSNCQVPHILITSRNKKWPKSIKVLSLDAFNAEEATDFIRKSLNVEDDTEEADIEELAKKLQYFPLALQQAVAYIKLQDENLKNVGSDFKVGDYLERCKEKTKQLLNFKFPEDSDNNYTKTVFVTWDVTFDAISEKVDGDIALEILNITSYFAPDNIPIELFLNLTNDKERLGSGIELLKQFSMVTVEEGKLIIHRLIQQVTRFRLEDQSKEVEILKKALKLFNKENFNSINVDHVISVWNYSSKYNDLVIEFTHIPTYITAELINADRYDESYLFGLDISKLVTTISSNDPDFLIGLLTVEHNIACALMKKGKFSTALQIFEQVLDVQNDILEPNASLTLKTKSNIASALYEQGKYTEALKHYQEVLGIQRITLGESHPDTLLTKRNTANTLLKQCKFDEALPMLLEVCSIQENTLGKKHSETLQTKNSIASAFLSQCKLDKALQMFREVLAVEEITLKKNHSNILHTKNNIAATLFSQGKYNEAYSIYQEINEAEKEVFGVNHPSYLSTRRHIALILRSQNKYTEALQIFQEVLVKQKKILGSDHPDVLDTQCNVANVLEEQGKTDEALQMYKEVLSVRKRVFGNDHPQTLQAYNAITLIFGKRGEYDKALEGLRKIYESEKNIFGEDHHHTLTTKNNIGMALYSKNEYDKALKIFQEVFDKLQIILPDHPDTLSTKNSIGSVLTDMGKYDEALKIFREVLDYQEAIAGNGYYSTVSTKGKIAGVLLKKGRRNEALKVLREILKSHNEVLGEKHEKTINMAKLIQSLSSTDNDLLISVRTNNFEKTKQLIETGRDVNIKDEDAKTPLHYAVNNGNVDIVNILLKSGADATRVTRNGNTPLHTAAAKKHKEIVEILLQHVSRDKLSDFIDAKTVSGGTTSLHVAVKNGSYDIVNILLKHGATYEVKNKENKMPIDMSENENVTKLLKQVADCFKDTKNGEIKVAEKLKSSRTDEFAAVMNTRDSKGHTLLQVAMINKHKAIASKLLEMLKS